MLKAPNLQSWKQYNWGILEDYEIKLAPPTAYYIPNIISEEEEEFIIKQINNAPKPKWTQLLNRRVQDYGGIPHPNGLLVDEIPSWLLTFMDRISDIGVFGTLDSKPLRANHCLINEYLPGQGIMPHSDGPLFTPIITTISCGSHTVLEIFLDKEAQRSVLSKIFLERRSLLILKDDMYSTYLHGIDNNTEDTVTQEFANIDVIEPEEGDVLQRETRLSLTIRNVPRILSASIFKVTRPSN